MASPIERFKDAYFNWRYNPFTAADMAIDKVEDGLFIPSGSPFVIQLLEQPRYNDPTSVSVRCYGVKTDVDQDSGSGQLILYVASTTDFSPGDNIIINRGGAREEERIIDTVQAGISLTVTVNLTYTHTAVQADDVEKFIAFTETAGAPAQSQFRVDYPPDDGEGTGLIEFNQNDADKEVRVSYKATGSPALAETLDTKISYPAGSPDDNQIVGFSSGVPCWLQLPHSNLAGISADQHHPQAHTLASHSTKPHSALTDVTANQHHPQAHTLASHSTKAHSELTGIGTGDHHAQVHTHASHTSIGANDHHPQSHTLASHSTKAHSELTGIGINDHHPKLHAAAHHVGGGDLINHDSLTGFVAAEHKSLPNTIANVLSNHTKAVHDALGIETLGAAVTVGGAGDGTITGGGDLYLEADDYVKSHTNRDHTTGAAATAIIGPTEGAFMRSTSALKYKENVKNLEVDSSLIYKLRPVSFTSKCKADDKKRRFIGLIADEIERYYPEIVNYNTKKEAESYDHQMILTLVLAEIQKINGRVKKLEA